VFVTETDIEYFAGDDQPRSLMDIPQSVDCGDGYYLNVQYSEDESEYIEELINMTSEKALSYMCEDLVHLVPAVAVFKYVDYETLTDFSEICMQSKTITQMRCLESGESDRFDFEEYTLTGVECDRGRVELKFCEYRAQAFLLGMTVKLNNEEVADMKLLTLRVLDMENSVFEKKGKFMIDAIFKKMKYLDEFF
jgi:hypothetical protein